MEEVVAPVFHEYNPPPEAVSVAACPAHIVLLVAVAVILPEETTVAVCIALQPFESVIVAV